MAFSARQRLVNPRLGTYFSIFVALFAALFLISLILEQLQVSPWVLKWAMFFGPLIIYGAIGLSVWSNDTLSYFAAGRRVPSVYTGLLLAASSIGGTLFVAGTGAMFFNGFDALVLLIGVLSGFVVMAMALAPFYRKFGSYTVPSYLGRRFDSKTLRILSAVLSAIPLLLMLGAELQIAGRAGAQMTGLSQGTVGVIVVLTIVACTAPGGKRSFSWSGVAQALALFLALVTVATTVSVLLTSLPIPQLANGPMVRGLARNEVAQGLQPVSVWPLAFGLQGEGFAAVTKPYIQPFGAIGPLGFLIGTIILATGIASAPWLLPRVAAASGVYEARKALGWATVFAGLTLLTLTSVAVFMRDFLLDTVMSDRVGPLPQWLSEAAQRGFLKFDAAAAQIAFDGFSIDRDSVLFTLPLASGLAGSFADLTMAGAIAAALVTAAATVVSLAAMLSEDVVQGISWEPAPQHTRVWLMRVFVPIAAISGASVAALTPADPLHLVFWALALSGSSLFTVLVLSVWWKRMTTAGAVAGVAAGFGFAAFGILGSEAGILSLPSMIAGVLGLPASVLAAMGISAMRPEAHRHALQVVRDMRVPGGEIIYDREMQRLQLQKRSKA